MLFLLMDMVDSPKQKRKIELLYDRYNRLMYTIAYRILNHHEDAEDAVLSSWEKIIRHLGQIPDLPEETGTGSADETENDSADNKKIVKNKKTCNKIKAFLVTVVERTAIDIYRKRKRIADVDLTEFEESAFFSSHEEAYADAEVKMVLEKLPKIYAEVMFLYFIYDFSYRDIADTLGLSETAVASRVMRGKQKLMEVLHER